MIRSSTNMLGSRADRCANDFDYVDAVVRNLATLSTANDKLSQLFIYLALIRISQSQCYHAASMQRLEHVDNERLIQIATYNDLLFTQDELDHLGCCAACFNHWEDVIETLPQDVT